jgi:hypothetical protein
MRLLVMSEKTAPVNAQERASTMVCDIRFRRFFRRCWLIVAACATSAACTPFGEAPGDGPPVEIVRSNDPTTTSAEAGVSDAEAAPATDASGAEGNTGGCNGAVACKRVVFVTSTTLAAFTIGGLAAADARCTALAKASTNARVAGRSYVAWLSDSTASPLTRMVHGTDEYIRPDLAPIAKSFADLTSRTTLAAAIALDETGTTRSGAVWTGTAPSGEGSGGNCSDWIGVTGGGAQGVIGTSRKWTNAGPPIDDDGDPGWCAVDTGRLYCFEK